MADDVPFDEFFLRLPGDPEEAYVVYQKRCADDLESDTHEESGYFYHRQYADKILAFDEVYGLHLFGDWSDSPNDDREFGDYFWPFKRATEKAALKFQLERARRVAGSGEGLVVLDASSRQAIRKLIEALRGELERLDLTESKRSALFNKLNAFAREVDQNLTRTEALFRLAADIGKMVRETGDIFKPAMERVDRMLDMVERAQKWTESLPPWAKRKEIPPPAKQIEGPGAASEPKGMDDDIPF